MPEQYAILRQRRVEGEAYKRNLVTAVSEDTANKFAYVIL
jgi:hypothetical protein